MPERLPEFRASLPEIVSCLDGQVYLASARRPGGGTVVAAGFGHEDALTRAETRARALDDVNRIPASPDLVAGKGVANGVRYLLPAEAVRLGEAGVVEDPADQVSSAIADVLACHVLTGWWGHPGIPLLRVTGQLKDMIAPAEAAGLTAGAFVLPGTDFQTVLACVAGPRGAVLGIAAGRLVASAASVAFLRGLAAYLRSPGVGTADHLAWRCRTNDIAWLERSALAADLTRADELAFWEGLPDWADIARRQFGHEPVLFSAGGHPAKVVCPGARGLMILNSGLPEGCCVPWCPGAPWCAEIGEVGWSSVIVH